MTDKPSRNEEEYFARREAELRKERKEASDREAADAERQSHYMKCPKCGHDLATERYHGIEVDRCTNCSGVWFDAGETEQLIDKDDGVLSSVFGAIVRGVRGNKPAPSE